MCFCILLAWPLRPFFPSLNFELQCSQQIVPSVDVHMLVKSGVDVVIKGVEMVVAGDEAVRCDDALGEQSMMVSTTLTILITIV